MKTMPDPTWCKMFDHDRRISCGRDLVYFYVIIVNMFFLHVYTEHIVVQIVPRKACFSQNKPPFEISVDLKTGSLLLGLAAFLKP